MLFPQKLQFFLARDIDDSNIGVENLNFLSFLAVCTFDTLV